jgi:hypothetical protein
VLQRARAAAPRAAGLDAHSAGAEAAAGAPPLDAAATRAPRWRAQLRAAAPLVALPRGATLPQLLSALLAARAHRAFILPEGHPGAGAAEVAAADVAVVSLTDALRAVADARGA